MTLVVLLLFAGFVLVGLEILLPGMVAGSAGALCLVAGVVVAYDRLGITGGNLTLLFTGTTAIAGFFLWLRFFPQSRLGRRFVSDRTIGEIGAAPASLLHRSGTALTTLRPSGAASIDGRRVDVITEGSLVTPGTPVRVIAIEGLRVVVRAVHPNEASPTPSP